MYARAVLRPSRACSTTKLLWPGRLASWPQQRSWKHTRTDVFKLLQLKSFDDQEIRQSFALLRDAAQTEAAAADRVTTPAAGEENPSPAAAATAPPSSSSASEVVNVSDGLQRLLQAQSLRSGPAPSSSTLASFQKMLKREKVSDKSLTLEEFMLHAKDLGEKLDRRIYSIAASFLFTGVSVGIIIPCMPLLVSELQLPPSDMGMIVSAFGLSKLLANMPSAYLVDKYGRKPAISSGLALCGLGIGAISLTLLPGFGSTWLVGCRLLSGIGVSAFLAGGFMFVSDISTALNRTRTIAPVMASFHAGSALGPAIGGVLVQHLGLAATYATVGGLFLLNVVSNHATIAETRPASSSSSSSSSSSLSSSPPLPPSTPADGWADKFRQTLSSWTALLSHRPLRDIVAVNAAYWFVWSGAQMTLLPLFVVSNPVYQLSPTELGTFFAASSVVSFLSAQPVAYVADKCSKPAVLMTGLGLVASCIAALPWTESLVHLYALLVPLALGSTIVNALPTSMVTDASTEAQRAQALSLLRTAGDLGLLLGATSAGLVASHFDLATGFAFDGGVMAVALAWYAARRARATKPHPSA